MDPLLSAHSSVGGRVACFYLSMIVNGATLYLHLQVFVSAPVFNSLGHIPRGGTSGSCENSMFSFWRKGSFLIFIYLLGCGRS